MKAVCFNGVGHVEVETVPDPVLLNPRDAIVRISLTAICGSDLHLYDGFIPSMRRGDILGHEFMGEVVAVGRGVTNLREGDRVVVPFAIACGNCISCQDGQTAFCENSNPVQAALTVESLYGYSSAGLFGCSHAYGGYAGGQAEYVRVPYADVGPLKVPEELTDEQALFLSDILPSGYMAAENCDIRPGQTIAVWGCGPVGQFSIVCAYLLGARRVIAIDRVPERLALARDRAQAEVLNFEETEDIVEALREMTGGRGPDACIDAVGMEAHGSGLAAALDRAKHAVHLEMDQVYALRQAIKSCGPGGTVSIPGVYGGMADKLPIGAAFSKGLTLRMGQTHVHRYMPMLMERILCKELDPTFIITHRFSLEQAADAYRTFRNQSDGCIKVVMRPGTAAPC
jgi:threonine dehydrogenase-like Zn-dependent dehydrogenase